MMSKKTALILLMILLSLSGFSFNSQRNDSLKRLLIKYEKENKEDTVYANLLKKISVENLYANPSLSVEYIDKAQKIFLKKNLKSDVAACYSYKGRVYFQQEMYYLAMENYYKAYEIFQELKINGAIAYSLNDIANTYYAQKIYDVPLKYYSRAIKIFKSTKDNFGLAVAYNNIGLVKRNTNQLDSALYYFNLALELRRQLNDNFLIAHSYYYIGKIYRMKRDYSKAVSLQKQSIELIQNLKNPKADFRLVEGDSYVEIALCLSEQKLFADAEKNYLFALVIYKAIHNDLLTCNTYYEIGKLNSEIKNFRKATDNTLKALEIAVNFKYLHEQKKCLSLLYEINMKTNQKENALLYLKRYSDLSDTMANSDLSNKLNEVQIAIQTHSKDMENSYLRQKTKDIKRLSFAIILFLCSIILFAVYYVSNKHKNEKRWKQLSNVTFEGVLIHDKHKIIDCNNKFLQLIGYERKDLKKLDVLDLFEAGERDFIINKIHKEHISEYEYKLIRKDGSRIFAEILSRQTNFKGKEARVVAIRDITQRKQMEIDLKKYMNELKAINATKDKFFSIIAHDLRNPFLGIIGLTDHLITETTNKDYSNVNEFIELINGSAKRAYELLENLLEWSRSQTGHLKFEPTVVNVCNIAKEEIKLFDHIAQSKNIKISFIPKENISAFADENLVKSIFRNLISNAVKFTDKGNINIDIIQKADNVEISVKDTGVGITKKEADKIFLLESSQSTPGTSGEKGTGLGLILCKEFVEKNNGRIWFESEFGNGSTFCFTLPKAPKA